MWSTKNAIRQVLAGAGYQVQKINVRNSPSYQLLKTLQRLGVDQVFDVGANVGQFASELRASGFDGQIVSFEPLSSAHSVLTAAADRDANWIVHPRCALGERVGTTTINVSGNSVSSSVLPILPSHVAAAAASAYVSSETVPLLRFDGVADTYLASSSRAFLKIDAQGYEWQVLEGAEGVLSRMHGVLCELSLIPLYDGQHLWRQVIARLESSGFTLWSVQKGFADPRDGRTLQLDAAFVRL